MTPKKRATAAVLCAAVMLLGGCEIINPKTAWTPQETDAISIASDGSVTEIVNEVLDQSYYDIDELETMIQEEVKEYNDEKDDEAVVVKEFTGEGTAVTLKIWYKSAEDFSLFNNIEFYNGSIIGAQLEDYSFEISFYSAQDGELTGKTVDYTSVFNDMSASVAIIQAPMEINVEGTVTFISTNAELISADTVIANGEKKESTTLILPSSAVYKGEEMTYEMQKEANRVYIIYNN